MDKWLLGVNSFYDRDTTAGNERLGLGLEAWTDYLKLAGNSYMRLSDWRQSKAVEDYQERPANGWDLRAEAFLPQYPQLGGKVIYEQYYGDEVGLFGSSNRQKDPSAATLGLSYTPIPLISMSTDYRQGQNGMSETSVRLGLNFQLGVPLKKQLSADELRASRLLVNSRYNLVSRNNEVVLDFKKNETGYIVLPAQIKGTANDTVMFPVNITGEVKNITWVGTASAYARTYGGSTSASLVLPPYNNNGSNIYTLKAIGSDRYGKIVESNIMQIGVESLKIAVERSVATVSANGTDEVAFTATLTKASGEIVSNSDLEWQVQGNANIVSKDLKTDTNGKAKLRLNSLFASAVSVTVSEPSGAKAEADVTFIEQESTAKVVSINATPNTVHADGISTSTLVANVQNVNNQPVGAGTKVNWDTNLGTLSAASSETDSSGKATVTINSNVLGTATINANAVKGSSSTTVVFDAIPAVLNEIDLSHSANSIVADGMSQSIFTAKVKDVNGNLLNNVVINWSSDLNGVTLSATSGTTNASGETAVTATSGTTAGQLTITATTANGSKTSTITLTAPTPVPVSGSVNVTPASAIINADGTSTSEIVATVKANGIAVPVNTEVDWSTTEGTLANAKTKTDANGIARNTLTSASSAGTATITASSVGTSGNTTVEFEVSTATLAELTPQTQTIKSDGVEKATITAIVKNADGTPARAGLKVNFSHNIYSFGAFSSNSVTTNSNGMATVTFTGTLAFDAIITGTLEGGSNNTATASVSLTPYTDYSLIMNMPSPPQISSDGVEFSTISVKAENSDGTPATNVGITWYAQGGILSSNSSTTDANGNASIKLTGKNPGMAFVLAAPVGDNSTHMVQTQVEIIDYSIPFTPAVQIIRGQRDLNIVGVSYDPDTGDEKVTIAGNIRVRTIKTNGSSATPIPNASVTIECFDGSKCLSDDTGTSILSATTVTTDGNGFYILPIAPSQNQNRVINFKATYNDDPTVAPDIQPLAVYNPPPT